MEETGVENKKIINLEECADNREGATHERTILKELGKNWNEKY